MDTTYRTSEPITQPSAPIAAWVREQLADTNRRLLSPYLTDGRRARLERRASDLQKLIQTVEVR